MTTTKDASGCEATGPPDNPRSATVSGKRSASNRMAAKKLPRGSKPISLRQDSKGMAIGIYAFVIIPVVVLIGALFALPSGLVPTWTTWALFVAFYVVSGIGVTAGYHRCFTHLSFVPSRQLKIALAVAGSLSIQGSVIQWVADHRRHHAFSDWAGDPHSPWVRTLSQEDIDEILKLQEEPDFGDPDSPYCYGYGIRGIAKGFGHAHTGWMFGRDPANIARFALPLTKDKDLVRIDKLFPAFVATSILLPGILNGLITWSWSGFLLGVVWAGVIRFMLLHHVTWSINSICHMMGNRPYESKDRSTNFWPLAVLSFGESWHNTHHADPSCAVHGVDDHQLDITARLIWIFERTGMAAEVHWPEQGRYAPKDRVVRVRRDGSQRPPRLQPRNVTPIGSRRPAGRPGRRTAGTRTRPKRVSEPQDPGSSG